MPNAFRDEKQEGRKHLNYNSMQEQIIYPSEDPTAVKSFLRTPMAPLALLSCLCRAVLVHCMLVPSYVCAFD